MSPVHHATTPAHSVGYELEPIKGYFSVIEPEATVNLCTNPSFETDAVSGSGTGYTKVNGGEVATVTLTYQRRGGKSLGIVPVAATDSGVYYAIALVQSLPYTASLDFLGLGGVLYELRWGTAINTRLAGTQFRGTGRWQRISVTYTETANATRRLLILQLGGASLDPLSPDAPISTFYIDGVQIEQKGYATTYCDGDEPGILDIPGVPAYSWDGVPHASTSRRSAQTRAGGRVRSLLDLGFHVLSYTGLGLSPVQTIATPYGALDGSLYRDQRLPERPFAIVGEWMVSSKVALDARKKALEDLMKPDRTTPRSPFVLVYQPRDDAGNPNGDEKRIICTLKSGLEGNTDNVNGERDALSLVAHDPCAIGPGGGASLTNRAVIAAGYIMRRKPDGTWDNMNGGLSGGTVHVNATVIGPDGKVYVFGAFTTAGGVGALNAAVFDPILGTWAAMGSGLNAAAYCAAMGPDGKIYVGGAFTLSGATPLRRVAAWDTVLGTWSEPGGGVDNNIVYAIDFTLNGALYVAGTFTAVNTGTATSGIAKMASGTTVLIGIGGGAGLSSANGRALCRSGIANRMYVGGNFATATGNAGAVTVNNFCDTDGSTFYPHGVGTNNIVYSIRVWPGVCAYLGGTFTLAGGLSIPYLAKNFGSAYYALGGGVADTQPVFALGPDGTLYANGNPTDVYTPDGAAFWNGTRWYPLDCDFPGGFDLYSTQLAAPDGTLYISNTQNGAGGNGQFGAVTTVTNAGSAVAYPRVVALAGATGGRIVHLKNTTTGAAVYFDSLDLFPYETLTFDFTPGSFSIVSNYRGDVSSYVIEGSNAAGFNLLPGANTISLFITDSTFTATMSWQNRYGSLSG